MFVFLTFKDCVHQDYPEKQPVGCVHIYLIKLFVRVWERERERFYGIGSSDGGGGWQAQNLQGRSAGWKPKDALQVLVWRHSVGRTFPLWDEGGESLVGGRGQSFS